MTRPPKAADLPVSPLPASPLPGSPAELFVKVYHGMVLDGLMARISGNELKVLLALALDAKVLGGNAQAERHFERLKSLAIVTEADRGRLFCQLNRDTIAERTGLNAKTVSAAANALRAKQLIEKRSARNHSGQHDYNVYFIRPESHLGKFDFNRRSSPDTPEPAPDQGKNLLTAQAVGKKPPPAVSPYVKKKRNDGRIQPVSTSHSEAVVAHEQWPPQWAESHPVLRKPKSEAEQLWERILGDLYGQMRHPTFDHLLRGSELLHLHRPDDGPARLVVRVSSPAAVDWLEHRLQRVVRCTVERYLGHEAGITFQTSSHTHACPLRAL